MIVSLKSFFFLERTVVVQDQRGLGFDNGLAPNPSYRNFHVHLILGTLDTGIYNPLYIYTSTSRISSYDGRFCAAT